MKMNKHKKTEKQGLGFCVFNGGYGPLPNGFTVAELFRMHFVMKLSQGEELSFGHSNFIIYVLLKYNSMV